MVKPKRFLPKLLYNKFFLQLILAIFMVGMAVFFLSHEHVEVLKIRQQLASCNPWWVALGLLLTISYVIFMGLMYVHTFKAIGKKVSLKSTVRLYLKRNVVSVFLPAGGFSSLLFFTKEVESEGASKSQIHLASTLFGFMSIMSVVVIAIPILAYTFFQHNIQQTALWGFLALLTLTIVFFLFLYSLFKKTWAYNLLTRMRPAWVIVLDEMLDQNIRMKNIWLALLFSVFIEIIGVLHLYISMLALGVEPSLMASMIGYVTMVMLLMASPFLRGLGAIEISITYILGQYGYPIIIAASMTLLYRFFEFWIPLVAGMLSFISKKDNIVLRLLPGFMIFALALVNIISSLTPAVPERLLFLENWLNEGVLITSNGLVLVIGLFLLILFVFLLQGSKRAWYVAFALSILSGAGHLLKGVDYEEAILALVAAVTLWRTRDFYKLKAHPELFRISSQVLIISVLALLTFGVAGFSLMDKRHFGMDFEFLSSVKTMLRMFFLFDDGGLVPHTVFARNFIYAIYTAGGLVICFVFFSILKPIFARPYNTPEEKDLAALILQKYGDSSLDYFKIYPDKLFFIADDNDGFVSFKVTRGYAVALGNPVCKDDEAAKSLIQAFDKYCMENGFTSVFYRVPKESLPLYEELGKKNIPVGDEGFVDLETFSLNSIKMESTRKTISHLQGKGFISKVYTPPIPEVVLKKLEVVSESWLHELHEKEMAFTEGVFDRTMFEQQVLITVEDADERIFAFLNIIPDDVSGEAAYDLIRKSGDAPVGVMDMLLVRTMLYFKEKGFKSVNLGMAPLSGIEGTSFTERTVRFAYENLKSLGHFKGLRKYKEKFSSRWEQKFLVYNNNYHLPQIPKVLKRVSKGK
ncbi:MAG TPA: phosphatidylglycerol lysyltransferase domain-containing protein [Bacteroidales bacterium]|nr:phosphatidylglycerol lysyltransferase domain-containing protein [Bacteroidales bacterium]